jgi:uncharacterized protein YyaL (SSP411 family)
MPRQLATHLLLLCLIFYAAMSHAEPETPHQRPTLPSPEEIAQLPPDGGDKWNRLIFEQSPYLLQHAANPVDWWPWSDAAFEKARAEDKPVFLSIGYSTCHWCHVMEHESFEDDEVAALLNKDFISIKMDREERPDIDHVYMQVAQAITGHGGWPLSVWMTPDRKPFFVGTYFPKRGNFSRPGMTQLLPGIASAWQDKREELVKQADHITDAVQGMGAGAPGGRLTLESLNLTAKQLGQAYDPKKGGFGHAPKFPTPHNLSFLLRHHHRTGDAKSLEMVEKTLTEMRRGGMYDQVGFGFHRYSTDQDWFLPHFEKMLYDQALLAIAYTEAYQVTGRADFAEVVREIFTYVQRDMTSPQGGFYSAEDADSEGEEGKFYLWSTEEVRELLGEEDAALFESVFNFTEEGTYVEEATGEIMGTNIPHLKASWSELATTHNTTEAELRERIEAIRVKLFDVREERVHPYKDDKILTDWNGLMIAAFAIGGRALGEEEYIATARKAADFVLAHLKTEDGHLLKRSRLGKAGLTGLIEDYSFTVWGLLEVYEATFEPTYLAEAVALTETQLELFWDDANGGLFMTPDDAEYVLVRAKEIYDGAIPSGNSVAVLNLARLARLTGNMAYEEKAGEIVEAFSGQVDDHPRAFTQLMIGIDFLLGPSQEVVIAGTPGAGDTQAMIAAVREKFLPRKVVMLRPEGDAEQLAALVKLALFAENQTPNGDAATAYVCQNFACDAPTTDIATMLKSLGVKN